MNLIKRIKLKSRLFIVRCNQCKPYKYISMNFKIKVKFIRHTNWHIFWDTIVDSEPTAICETKRNCVNQISLAQVKDRRFSAVQFIHEVFFLYIFYSPFVSSQNIENYITTDIIFKSRLIDTPLNVIWDFVEQVE